MNGVGTYGWFPVDAIANLARSLGRSSIVLGQNMYLSGPGGVGHVAVLKYSRGHRRVGTRRQVDVGIMYRSVWPKQSVIERREKAVRVKLGQEKSSASSQLSEGYEVPSNFLTVSARRSSSVGVQTTQG